MNLLITGGSSDITKAIAQRRMQTGDKIIITSSSSDSLNQTLEEYKQQQMPVQGFVYTFSDPQSCEKDLEALLQEPLDGLILNAFERVDSLRKFHEYSYNELRSYMDNNLHGTAWLIHRLLPQMLSQQFGRLILISSVSAVSGTSRYSAYCTVKAALEGLFLNLAVEYSHQHVLSNILRLGLIKTSRTQEFWNNPLYQKKMGRIIPQGALGEPEQVAEALDPLLSKTSYLSGSIMTVSGGLPLIRSEGLLLS